MPLREYKASLIPHQIKSDTEVTIKFSIFRDNYVELEFYEFPNKVFNISLSLVVSLDRYFNKSFDYFSSDFWRGIKITLINVDTQLVVKLPIQYLFCKSINETGNYIVDKPFNNSLEKKIGSFTLP